MKILVIVGARPQFVKLAAFSRGLQAATGRPGPVVVHTGQHYDDALSKVFFTELQIPEPDFNLGIGSAPHGAQTGRMLEAIEQVLVSEKPDWTVVLGDTNSTLAGALAASKLRLPLAHVEAGLRSRNRAMPEEINRIVTDHVADLNFAPTRVALNNLSREGVPEARMRLVGDVMYDAALFYGKEAQNRRGILNALNLIPGQYVLCTIHRAENTDNAARLGAILGGLRTVAKYMPVVLPIHPRTRKAISSGVWTSGWGRNLRAIDPVGYLDMVSLEANACGIATDSGGVQKEAFFHRVPCVTLRNETEWTELLELGWNTLVPPESPELVASGILNALNKPGKEAQPFGDGKASELIARILLESASK